MLPTQLLHFNHRGMSSNAVHAFPQRLCSLHFMSIWRLFGPNLFWHIILTRCVLIIYNRCEACLQWSSDYEQLFLQQTKVCDLFSFSLNKDPIQYVHDFVSPLLCSSITPLVSGDLEVSWIQKNSRSMFKEGLLISLLLLSYAAATVVQFYNGTSLQIHTIWTTLGISYGTNSNLMTR